VLVPASDWELERRLTPAEAAPFVDSYLEQGPDLLGGDERTLSEQEVADAPPEASLAIVEAEGLYFEHENVPWGNGSRVWARFRLGGREYGLTVSDFIIRPRLLKRPFGTYSLEDLDIEEFRRSIVTASLADAWNGIHYKLAAAIFELP
jgi:hypothetical protein